jgi:hypothetical protein
MTKTRNILGIEEEELSPGLWGYTMEHGGALYIPLVIADKPGNGALRTYLDHLEATETRPIKFPNVINHGLAKYLARRGYRPTQEWAEAFGEHVIVWVKEKP